MVNINGKLVPDSEAKIDIGNRGYTYGDAVFETIRVHSGDILFWEAHYFRLMASMRILRMSIPDTFTPEFLKQEILDILSENSAESHAVRIKIIVNRKEGGLYTPASREVDYMISMKVLENDFYKIDSNKKYEVTLFKDHYVAADLLSTIKSNNKLVNILGGIFAKENDFDNCLLLNTNKMVVEALNGNLFLVSGNNIKTPPVSDGCLRGIMRLQIIAAIKKMQEYTLEEASISPFELQKADELFISNVIIGVQPIKKFRKKEYAANFSKKIMDILNNKIVSEERIQ